MDEKAYQAIIKAAIDGEIEAHQFYKQVAATVDSDFLKSMFEQFAVEEDKHRRLLEGFLNDTSAVMHFASVPDYEVAATVDEPALSMDMQPADAIALAMKKEEAAMQHYTRLAQACDDPERAKVFLQLASMEREHKYKMEQAFVDIGYPEVW